MVDEASMEAIIERVQSELHSIDLFRDYTFASLRRIQT